MPLIPAPNTGYPDWQRTANYDLAPLLQWNHPLGSGDESSSVIAMGHYGYLAGTIQITSGDVLVQMLCATDIGMADQAGSRGFVLSSSISNQAQMYLPALGPYMEVVVSSTTAGNWAGQANLFASNRIVPLEFTPFSSVVLNAQNRPVAASTTTIFYPTDYYAGPATVAFGSPTALAFYLQYEDFSGNWDSITPSFTVAAGNSVIEQIYLPPGAWRVAVPNTGAATTCTIAVVQSQSGA